MSKIEVVNTETGEHLFVEKMQYWRSLRRVGIWELLEDYEAPAVPIEKPEIKVVKRGRGRPRKEA